MSNGSYQKLTLVGNLGQDPEMRYTPNGQPVTNFSMATNRRWTDNNGVTHEETAWWRISVWGKQAETCNQYLRKGRKVLVDGRIIVDRETGSPRIWTDQNGNARCSLEVNAFEVVFMDSGNGNGNGNGYANASGTSATVEQYPELADEEIPF